MAPSAAGHVLIRGGINLMKMASGKLRVAVIGAGAAGLCCAHNLLARPSIYEAPVVFETTGQVGGTWVYTEGSETNSHVHSSMYRDLRTNLPKEIMEFPDFSFDPSVPSFPHHSKVLEYLEDYTDKLGIRPHIRFNCTVEVISPVLGDGDSVQVPWEVTFRTQGDAHPVTQRFEAVMVCAGHYSKPYIPDIAGMETFQGQVLHSHVYRYPEVFSSRSVVLLGSGPSGVDIAMELASYAKEVTLSHRGSPLQWTLPKNVSLAPAVVHAAPHTLTCSDGTELKADTLIFCTGYKYNYPFLVPARSNGHLASSQESLGANNNPQPFNLLEDDEFLGPDMGQGHLPPLYKHLIHARYPTLCFIGACKKVVPFPLFNCQALFFLAVLEGKCQLPRPSQMLSESREELKKHLRDGLPLKYLHRLERDQWKYNRCLEETAGFEPLPPVLEKIYEACKSFRKADPTSYRELNFQIVNKDQFRIISS
ncbi:flavin-containing monooxygenase FMO GS-OX-like 4 isoform X2 [Xenopus tropicalis]|uniref:Flavin-containing monooxygenase n=1 Tax=Xenopus tropicalis TaxID=8364 RepID=A0A803KG27_XENTR|nr:flavin-containing monooxygenase FMO GS-OX-like 4 isoform X2 [Xenopus tropicalis]